jgi:hypothetical protein
VDDPVLPSATRWSATYHIEIEIVKGGDAVGCDQLGGEGVPLRDPAEELSSAGTVAAFTFGIPAGQRVLDGMCTGRLTHDAVGDVPSDLSLRERGISLCCAATRIERRWVQETGYNMCGYAVYRYTYRQRQVLWVKEGEGVLPMLSNLL